jgi:selenide,water dikinase
VGLEKADDAGVYRLTPDLAIIQTVDFFAPIVDDPFTFGRVAATNAMSDVYAMGGTPVTVMNIMGFPKTQMPMEVLTEILKGGLEATREAGAVLAGGHTVDDAELKYGLSVTGIVHPDKVVTNSGARSGDLLILTKPLGTGIIATALKRDAASPSAVDEMVRHMCTLNRAASEAMQVQGVHACTDVTGFGLLGHAWEMMQNSGVGMEIRSAAVPFMEGVLDYTAKGMVPGGAKANKDFYGPDIRRDNGVGEDLYTALHDPQTSGGLLIAVPIDKAYALTEALKARGVEYAVKIGECTDRSGEIVVV